MAAFEDNLAGVGAKRRRLTEPGQCISFMHNTPITVETTQEKRIEYEISTNAPINSGSPYEFDIEKEMDTFLDMGSLSLTAELRIVKADGSNCADTDIVAPINLFASSLWERVEVRLNKVTSNMSSSDYFHYKTFLETILSYEGDARETHLRTQLFMLDTPGEYDNFTAVETNNVEPNAGFVYRYKYTKNSRKFDVVCPLSTDILRSSKFLVPGVSLTLRLTKAPDRWLLLTSSNEQFKIKVEDLKLEYGRIKLYNPDFRISEIQHYPFAKTEMRKYPVPAGASSYTINIGNELDRVPKQIYFFMVKATTSEGDYKANPFNFQAFQHFPPQTEGEGGVRAQRRHYVQFRKRPALDQQAADALVQARRRVPDGQGLLHFARRLRQGPVRHRLRPFPRLVQRPPPPHGSFWKFG
jgi:hypothetical protein